MVYWNAGVHTLSPVPEKIELADYNVEGPKCRLENYVEEFWFACIRIHPSKKPSIYEAYGSSLSFLFLGMFVGLEHDMSM
ncbi:hypothetical protein PAHAL_9G265000 [Panicum hallii]|jgi:hypothetical protein|uniref:Uncharacterized protein n=1 Tax=Panicum hallii TaxID=206008 RepID=A0A2T8I2M1_9POAL|nr:hypothetical protein PAHAL_9G265000 [Panicum hallii]